jgi:hypothetical protein
MAEREISIRENALPNFSLAKSLRIIFCDCSIFGKKGV